MEHRNDPVRRLMGPIAVVLLACTCLAACGSSSVQGKGGAVPLAGKGSPLPASWVSFSAWEFCCPSGVDRHR
jgi:predicted small secreted protein